MDENDRREKILRQCMRRAGYKNGEELPAVLKLNVEGMSREQIEWLKGEMRKLHGEAWGRKRGNPDGKPRVLSPVEEMWRRKEESELREIERSGLVTEEAMEMFWRKFRERYENPHTIRTMKNPSGNPTEIYECPEGGWGIIEIDGIHYLTRQGVVQRRISEGDFGYAELIKHVCPLHDVELVKR